VVQDGKEFTLGFSPSVSKYLPMPGLFKPVEAAIFIPDIQVEIALKTGTATEIKRSDGEPFLLSEEAATRLNEYTCNGIPGVKETFEMARLNPEDRAEWEDKILFTRKFVPKNLKYRFVSNADECTNCQGFLSTIFANDPDVIKTIMPFLHEWGSKAVAQHKQALRAPRSSFFDHLEKGTYLGLGGNKKSRKPKKHRKKTRKAGASSTQKEHERNLQASLQLALPREVALPAEQQDEQLREFEARLNALRQRVDTAEVHRDDLQEWGPEAVETDDTLEEQTQRLNDLMARLVVLQQHQQNPHPGGRKRKRKKRKTKRRNKRRTKRRTKCRTKRKRRRTKRR